MAIEIVSFPIKHGDFPYNVVPLCYKLVYKPHENYSYLRTINHSDIGVMFTNLANELGHHLVVFC